MAVQIVPTSRNGNGHAVFPLSRKAFHRSLPGRFGVVEDTLETMERRLDDFICRLTAIEQRPVAVSDPGLEARLDNLVEIVTRMAVRVERVDRRSARSRRRVAAIADQLAD